MKTLFTFCLTLASVFTFGQFAIIHDKDSFCNVRSSPGKGNNIIDTLENGHLVSCFATNSNWINIDYIKNKKELNGHVYKDRITFVSTYSSVPLLTENNSTVIFKKDSIRIILTQEKFDGSKHKLGFFKGNKDQLELIDGKQYWGTDGRIPKTGYCSVEIFIGKKKISLPKKALENLYEISLFNTQINYDDVNDIFYIQSMNSDGAGAYEVIWKIEKGIYKDRFIAYGY